MSIDRVANILGDLRTIISHLHETWGSMTAKIGINGFGRIGRVFFRIALGKPDFWDKAEVIAVNDLADARTLAHLLKYDSVHGVLRAEVKWRSSEIEVGGRRVTVISESDPARIPWRELGVDIVIESTGRFRERSKAAMHLEAGAKKVLISAPARSPDATVIPGVNLDKYDPAKHNIVSMASCTTNCLAVMVKVLDDKFGVKRGMMTTCHAYTNDQRLLDLPHRDLRRARAAAISIVPTTTGAAEAIGLVMPKLAGKLTGIALRVPVPNGSITDLVVELEESVTREEINREYIRASEEELAGILGYTEDPIVSSDIIGTTYSCIIDGASTHVLGGRGEFAKILGWYDNEWGYAARLVELAEYVAERL